MQQLESQSMVDLLEIANGKLQDKMPFVLYNKPNSKELIGVFQKNDSLYTVKDFEEQGFVFAPFDESQIVLFPAHQSEIKMALFEVTLDLEGIQSSLKVDRSEVEIVYESLINKAIQEIQSGHFSKVVLSRKETVKLLQFNAVTIFQRLFNFNPTAFSYCFYHPKVGLWMGAFSEQLLKKEGTTFFTSAVAGTQLFQGKVKVQWGNKEQQEQQYVSDFILEKVKETAIDITVSKPYTIKAGTLLHLKTDIQGKVSLKSSLKEMLELIHPTPAVCGLPLDKAKAFIRENEGYNREYYSGYLGELNTDFISQQKSTDLYVNLRCMKIDLQALEAHIYVGGGITKDSIPEKEWNETINKSKTIGKVLEIGF